MRFLYLVVLLAVSLPAQAEELPSCVAELVCDADRLLLPEQQRRLADYHAALLERYDLDMRVMTVAATPERVKAIFTQGRVGENSKTRRGLLLVVDKAHNLVRLEISAGLDAVFTDGFVAYIEQRQMVPFFKANRVADGILAATELLVARAQQAQAGQEFIEPQQLPDNLAIGAGAQTAADIGKGGNAASGSATAAALGSPSASSPYDTVAAYHRALEAGDARPDLPIYSMATRSLRQKWVVTQAQMKNELRSYKGCDIDKVVTLKNNTLAVVRYKVDQRKCAPYFLVMEDGAWRLDFVTMMQNVRFNVDNEWHLDLSRPLPYADAFLDWTFNRNGYPFQEKMRWGINVGTNYSTNTTTVRRIFPGTPAASMPIQEGDVVVSWNGTDDPDYRAILADMDRLRPGENVRVRIRRNGIPMNLTLTAPPYVN